MTQWGRAPTVVSIRERPQVHTSSDHRRTLQWGEVGRVVPPGLRDGPPSPVCPQVGTGLPLGNRQRTSALVSLSPRGSALPSSPLDGVSSTRLPPQYTRRHRQSRHRSEDASVNGRESSRPKDADSTHSHRRIGNLLRRSPEDRRPRGPSESHCVYRSAVHVPRDSYLFCLGTHWHC